MKAPESDRSADSCSIPLDAGLDESLFELRELRDRTRKNALAISAAVIAVTVFLSLGALVVNGDFLAFVLVPGIILAVAVYTGMMRGVKLKYKRLVIPALLKEIDPGLKSEAEYDLGPVPRFSFVFELARHHSLGNKERKAEKVFFLLIPGLIFAFMRCMF